MSKSNPNESAWDRAIAESKVVYRSVAFQVGSGLVSIGAIAAVVATVAGSGEPTQTQIAVPILAGVVATTICFVAIFAAQLAVAPVRQRNELRDIQVNRSISPGIDFANEMRKGEDLYRSIRSSLGYTTRDEEAVEEWTERVVRLLANFGGDADAVRFMEASRGVESLSRGIRARLDVLEGISRDPDSPLHGDP